MLQIVYSILALGGLIFVHELGHFIAAKRAGVHVLLFSIGFGPKLTARKFGGTWYALSAIPLGGYIQTAYEKSDEGLSLNEIHPLRRIGIALAGPLANLLVALLIYIGANWYGMPTQTTLVGKLAAGFPAETAGMRPRDRVVTVNGTPVHLWPQFTEAISRSKGNSVLLGIQREDKLLSKSMAPRLADNRWILGIAPGAERAVLQHTGFEGVVAGTAMLVDDIGKVSRSFLYLLTGKQSITSIGGPILVVSATADKASGGAVVFLVFIGLLSINLFIFNLIPLPVLDGGMIVLLVWEMLFGKPVSARVKHALNSLGVGTLVALYGVSLFADITRLFH